MKIPQSVRVLYNDLLPRYQSLKHAVDSLIFTHKEARWHYESRVKGEESFALKLETGRVRQPRQPEDFFACTLVVENHAKIECAEKLITELFELVSRRPAKVDRTHLEPFSFDFDDLRLYVSWNDDPSQRPTGLNGLQFEVQIKTFLQHAWGIATHDFIYKTDEVDWACSRIAYQVKAMLENAELSISEAKKLTGCAMLNRIDRGCDDLRAMIVEIKERWDESQLPSDLRRFAMTLSDLTRRLGYDSKELWQAVDEATKAGYGTKILNLSPYGIVVDSLLRKFGAQALAALGKHSRRSYLFIPDEIDIPHVDPLIISQVIRST